MDTAVTTRLCWNCEGDVDAHSSSCPHCGAELGAEVQESSPPDSFEPAYKIAEPHNRAPVPGPAYSVNSSHESISEKTWNEALNGESGRQQMGEQVAGVRSWLSPLFMLLAGSIFFLFGLVLFLFADEGVFTLRWNANFSLFYLAVATPLLFYGWKALDQVKD